MLSVFDIIIFLKQHIRETRNFSTILLKHKYIDVSQTILDNDFICLFGADRFKSVKNGPLRQ